MTREAGGGKDGSDADDEASTLSSPASTFGPLAMRPAMC